MKSAIGHVSSVRFVLPAMAMALVCACSGKSADTPVALDAATAEAGASMADATSADVPTDADILDEGTVADAPYVPIATQVVDDMRGLLIDGLGTTNGGWGTYSDRVVAYSDPAIFIDGSAGVLIPEESRLFPPTTDGGGPTYLGVTWPYRRFAGGGESIWGAGMSMAFANAPPDGGPVSVNGCGAGTVFDVDAGAMDSYVRLSFDASAWTGIQFWAKSLLGYPRAVNIKVQDDRTDPFGLPADAGGCNACANLMTPVPMGYCGDGPQVSVVFPVDWTQIQVPFHSMHPAGYSGEPTTWIPDAKSIYTFNFELADAPLAPFDLGVAYIELYR